MIKGDYDFLKQIASRNVCAKCKSPLEVAWLAEEDSYVLGCGNCGYIDAVTRWLSLTDEYKAGEEIPEPIKSNIEKGQRRRQMTQDKTKEDARYWLIPKADLATGELLPPEVIANLINYARGYGLDPYRSHVVMMYGKPYITIDGYLYHARQSGKPYTLQSRPVTTEELEQYKIGPTDHGWLAKVIFTDTGDEFTGVGIVTYEEMTAKSPRDQSKLRSPVVAAHPWQLGQKRAEWQALRRAFPIGESEEIKSETGDKSSISE